MEDMAIRSLRNIMKAKFKDIKEDSQSILKRISAYQNLMKEEGPGIPHCGAVSVKIFENYFDYSQ